MGANSYIWKIRHIRLHHNYPNVMGWDSDIEQSEMARVFPHGDYSKMHKYQHIYLPFLYPFFLFNWLLIRDFKDFFNKKKVVWKVTSIPAIEYVKLFVFKAVFIFYTLFLPMLILHISFVQIFIAFLHYDVYCKHLCTCRYYCHHMQTRKANFLCRVKDGKMPTSWFYTS